MNQALLYSKNNELQKHEASSLLDQYFHLVRWKGDGGDAVLDVGCGTGNVTVDVLLPRISATGFRKLVAVDLEEEMVKFARTSYDEPHVAFERMDIAAEQVPGDFEGAFDHVFSFFCLHWVQNQRQAAENIFKMLTPGGDSLLTFITSAPIYKMYEGLAEKPLWEPYMKDFEKYVSPYYYYADPEKQLRELLSDQGFKVKVCKEEKKKYKYRKLADLKSALVSVNPFYTEIPEKLRENYVTDMIDELEKHKFINISDNNNDDPILTTYTVFVVYAYKPL